MRRETAYLAVLIVQIACAVVFLFDILITVLRIPVGPLNWQVHEFIQIGAAIGLIMGVVLGTLMLRASMRRADHVESQLRAASGAFMDLLEDHFLEWGLTPAERDVALFAIKGMSTAEIASLRDTSEGTVKAQTASIYRKAGVSGRPQLLSLFIDDLMDGGLSTAERQAS